MTQEIALSEFSTAQRWRSLIAVIGSVFGVGVSFGALVPLMSLTLGRKAPDRPICADSKLHCMVQGLCVALFPFRYYETQVS